MRYIISGCAEVCNLMIVQVFYKDIVKEFYFRNTMDGRNTVCLYSYETGLDEDIEFFIEVNNGVRRIAGKNIFVSGKKNSEDENIITENKLMVAESRFSESKIGILSFESDENNSCFKKYIVNKNYIEVGRDGEIKYSANNIGRYFAVSYEDSKAFVVPYINKLYLNGRLIKEKKRIRFGDIITYNKFKLVYLGNILAINNPDHSVKCSLDKFAYKRLPDVKGAEAVQDMDEEDLFTRSPRITHKPIIETKDIDPPTNKREAKEKPLLYTIGPSLTMSMAMIVNVVFMIKANSSGRSPIPNAVMALSMLMGAVLWPVLLKRFNKKQEIIDEEKRVSKYKEYIDSIDREMEKKAKYNRDVYDELYPSLESLIRCALRRDRALWDHAPGEEGFLDIRIGKGTRKFTIDINIQKERFSLEDDPLKKYASVIQQKYKYLHNVPVSVELGKMNILGIVGNREKQIDLIRLIITRIAITHCYDEVKIALLYGKREHHIWEFAKWLPHCWSDNKKIRMMADDRDGAYYTMSHLREIYEDRLNLGREAKASSYLPHYVIFITDYELVSKDAGLRDFIENSAECGFTFVLGYENIGQLPSAAQNIIQLSSEECTIYNKADNSGKMLSFIPDICEGTDIRKTAEALASVKVGKMSEESMVPERLSFFGLYKAKNIDELVIGRRWKESQSFKTLEAPIGMGAGDEVFSLNIHEKYHGPHGLIAGTTGSGKSEFIQSLILSLAINYHPYDVAFVLIDYKGGGMANAFVNLPHVAGTITNLEGNQIKRSLISLKSELKRRQAIFKEYGVNHIDSYQIKYKRGLASEPLPHLIIISDEFAELKSQEPEFMNELISTARIGRSLGVHLILATQKPSGVVNDQIWSNTRFRICLKVADRMDSKEMLKREDAAFITQPGRCYVQIGNDEIFKLVQSGYSGEKYIRDGSNISDESVVSVACVDLQGAELYRMNEETSKESDSDETQLSAVVEYIDSYSKKEGITPLKLWLPPLPKELYVEDIDKRMGGFNGEEWKSCMDMLDPIVGLYDEPERQMQNVVDVNFGKNGHLLLYGAPGTGKTTFLQTLIYSLAKRYSPEFVNMYVLDFGSRSLSYCKTLPHVADVLFSDDEDKIKKLFQRIASELGARKKALAEYGVGNLISYMQASGRTIPAIFIILDNYAAFAELYTNYDQDIIRLSREGGNYGIYLVFTSASVNGVKRRISENFKMVYTLQLNDTYDYASVLGRTEGVFPENVKGRGLVRVGNVLEFQTALAVSEINEAARAAALRESFALMARKWTGDVPKPLPVMPEDMNIDSVILSDEYSAAIDIGLIPIGYYVENVELANIDFMKTPIFTVYGEKGTGKTNFLACIIKCIKDRSIWLADNDLSGVSALCEENEIHRTCSCGSKEELSGFVMDFVNELLKRHSDFKKYREEGGKLSEREFVKKYDEIIFIIDDFNVFFSNIGETEMAYFKVAAESLANLGACMFVSVNSSLQSKYKSQLPEIFKYNEGIVLGNIENLSLYGISVPYAVKKEEKTEKGKGYFVKGDSYKTIRTPFVGKG